MAYQGWMGILIILSVLFLWIRAEKERDELKNKRFETEGG